MRRFSSLLDGQMAPVGRKRGFAAIRLAMNWEDIVGPDIAAISEPVGLSWGEGRFGATLTLMIDRAHGPMLDMEVPNIRTKVNDAFGHNPVTHVRFQQASSVEFARIRRSGPNVRIEDPPPAPEVVESAKAAAAGAKDGELRSAIESLAISVLSSHQQREALT